MAYTTYSIVQESKVIIMRTTAIWKCLLNNYALPLLGNGNKRIPQIAYSVVEESDMNKHFRKKRIVRAEVQRCILEVISHSVWLGRQGQEGAGAGKEDMSQLDRALGFILQIRDVIVTFSRIKYITIGVMYSFTYLIVHLLIQGSLTECVLIT